MLGAKLNHSASTNHNDDDDDDDEEGLHSIPLRSATGRRVDLHIWGLTRVDSYMQNFLVAITSSNYMHLLNQSAPPPRVKERMHM